MKKILFFSIVFIFITISSYASSENTLGLRLGNGYEISFQTPFKANRLEIDMGWSHQYTNATGLYQWVKPIQNNFNWYASIGADIGIWNGSKDYDNGLGLSALCGIGIEYNFDAPLQLSLDFRPALHLVPEINPTASIGLGIRYVFH